MSFYAFDIACACYGIHTRVMWLRAIREFPLHLLDTHQAKSGAFTTPQNWRVWATCTQKLGPSAVVTCIIAPTAVGSGTASNVHQRPTAQQCTRELATTRHPSSTPLSTALQTITVPWLDGPCLLGLTPQRWLLVMAHTQVSCNPG